MWPAKISLALSGQLDRGIPPALRTPVTSGVHRDRAGLFPTLPQASTTYFYWQAPKPSALCLNMPSGTRAPAGCPRSVANRKKRRFARSLSAHLRRQVQPHRRLLSRVLQTCSESGGELGERLNFASHISAEEGRETVLFLARNRLRAPQRGASIRREIQALSQRPWSSAQEIGSGCWSYDDRREATLVCTPEVPGVRSAGGIHQCGRPPGLKQTITSEFPLITR